ncbi:putative membrane protein [Bernardetia litoralis DSM 6794]|uniref:Putative membrane protein n=1 Tax=Bernardetia litoralis (strain ATCC 23117 / DSM 6794 / NBRC 15988 / NCIMB 1366 / Fx l1 / Sio-4) TaxID=880071 RepID=I4AGT0_BERLS|nr:carotenoid biosynthesis protein [Bernardetia litoralis]AFM03165.1 putative membrane protein [Bernardetia litoralis DSM 6794]
MQTKNNFSLIYLVESLRFFVQNNINFFGRLILVMYFAGLLGLWFEPTRELFEMATPFNLITSIIFLLLAQRKYSPSFWVFVSTTFFVGFFIEVIGVKTEAIFGTYNYGKTLGFKVFEVPLLIGINWIMITFIVNYFISTYFNFSVFSSKITLFIKSVFSAVLMVMLDYLIEPVAIIHDFWSWKSDVIPLQNYIGWFLVALPLCMLFQYSKFEKINKFAYFLLLAQLLFFGGYNLLMYFKP